MLPLAQLEDGCTLRLLRRRARAMQRANVPLLSLSAQLWRGGGKGHGEASHSQGWSKGSQIGGRAQGSCAQLGARGSFPGHPHSGSLEMMCLGESKFIP